MKTPLIGLIFAFLALLAGSVFAVFDAKLPFSKMFIQSQSITSGEITKLIPDAKVLEINPATSYKGETPATLIKIKIKEPVSLFDDLNAKNASKSAVIFDGARSAAIFIGDHWFSASPGNRPGTYIIDARITDLDPTIPTTTPDLLKTLAQLQANQKPPTTAPSPPATAPKN